MMRRKDPGTASASDASEAIASFAARVSFDRLPKEIVEKARALMLDCAGIAFASSVEPFATSALRGLHALGSGTTEIIGMNSRLGLRDGVLMNALLVHGLDFDDTHMPGIIHASASCFPCALGVAAMVGADREACLTAYVLGLEVASRLAMVAEGGFHKRGLHPTGLVGAFACSLVAGKLFGLNAHQLDMAQGIALSLAAGGSQEFLQEGAWTKRLHPGWGAAAGITAASLARQDFVGPRRVYEGRYGLYRVHLADQWSEANLTRAVSTLGSDWEAMRIAIKPFPICHYSHAAVEAALAIVEEHHIDPEQIESVEASLPADTHPIVCEPIELKRRPRNDYDARFSVPYAVAAAFVRRRLGLRELAEDARSDPAILALAEKVKCVADGETTFPRHFPGTVGIRLKDGRHITKHVAISRGSPERPFSLDEIRAKFIANATNALSADAAEAVADVILDGGNRQASELAHLLSSAGSARPR